MSRSIHLTVLCDNNLLLACKEYKISNANECSSSLNQYAIDCVNTKLTVYIEYFEVSITLNVSELYLLYSFLDISLYCKIVELEKFILCVDILKIGYKFYLKSVKLLII